jgi:Kdo2-lipid IVA lauroyltransferase/acyltransferase
LVSPRVQKLIAQAELGLYRLIIVPLIAFLPARLAYGGACLRGDFCYYLWDRSTRKVVVHNLELVLGKELTASQREQISRDFLRLRSCEAMDVMRLAGTGKALFGLVEIRGLEYVEAALASGKGALLCAAHLGSYHSCFSLLGARGLPITVVGRWPSKTDKTPMSSFQRFIFQLTLQKRVERHSKRPHIQPLPDKIAVAVQVANILRQNELVGTFLDPPATAEDRPRSIRMNFLNGTLPLLPGAIAISKVTGAPILMTFMRRSVDWRHQVLEISPPIPMKGDTVVDFRRCLMSVEKNIRENPAHWTYWASFGKETLQGLANQQVEPPESRIGESSFLEQ